MSQAWAEGEAGAVAVAQTAASGGTPALPPALVLGSGVTALGVARALGRAGIRVFQEAGSDEVLNYSRWCRPVHPRRRWRQDDGVEENLRSLPLPRAVLIPCSDALAMAVAGLPEELRLRFPSYLPPLSALRQFVDKGLFLQRLEACGVPHPRTYFLDEPSAVDELPAADPKRPLFIKPRDSQSFMALTGVKAIRPPAEELEDVARSLLAAGHRLLLQEYVPGPASNHYFIDGFVGPGAEIAATLVRRRLRMHPLDFGNSTLMVTVPVEEVGDAFPGLQRMFASVGYRGIFSAEFKRDADDGVLRILEVNARPWWYIEFASRLGVDVATMAYRAALGLDPGSGAAYPIGRRLVYPYYDAHACLEVFPSRLRASWRFLRDSLGADQAIFAWDDPGPAIARWGRYLAGRLRAHARPRRRG